MHVLRSRFTSRRTRRAAAFWLLASVVFSGLLGWLALTGQLASVEYALSGFIYARPGAQAPGNVVIVAIDDRTLNARDTSELGTLRLPKAAYADVISSARTAGAAAIGVDVILSEASDDADVAALTQVLSERDDVVLAARPADAHTEALLPLSAYQQARLGSVLFQPDVDGQVRRQSLTFASTQARVAFPVAVLDAFFAQPSNPDRWQDDTYVLTSEARRVGVARVEAVEIPTQQRSMLIRYFAAPGSVPRVSFADAREGRFVDAAGVPVDVRGKIVLIGEEATALHDEHTVPVSFGRPMAGVEIHANAIETMLSGSYLSEPSRGQLALVAIAWFVLALVAFLVVSTPAALVVFVVAVLAQLFVAWVAYAYGYVVHSTYPFLALTCAFGCAYAYRSVVEARTSKELTSAFSQYVSPHVVEELKEHPDRLVLGGDKREMTVLFSDIAGFTSIAESMDAHDLVEQLNEYLDAVSDVVLAHDGTIDKFIGDAVMAFWNAPLTQEDHAVRSCLAALAYQKRLDALNIERERHGRIRFEARIGVNSGSMIVGNIGSHRRFDYTVIGDAVNLASRLEGLNKQYGTQIIVSEHVLAHTGTRFDVRELDVVAVKGKDAPVRIYELLGERGSVSDDVRKAMVFFGEGLAAYRRMAWDDAERFFRDVLRVRPQDGPAQIFLKRIETLRASGVPQNWDGVYRALEK